MYRKVAVSRVGTLPGFDLDEGFLAFQNGIEENAVLENEFFGKSLLKWISKVYVNYWKQRFLFELYDPWKINLAWTWNNK